MAPKKATPTPDASSSKEKELPRTKPKDPTRFISREAEYRYDAYTKIEPIVERGFDFRKCDDILELAPVKHQIQARGWEKFVEHPPKGNFTILCEFMANAIYNKDSVFCRQQNVTFTPEAINNIYGLSNFKCDYEKEYGSVLPEVMSKVLCVPNFRYNPKKEVKQVTSSVLTFEAKVWFYFVISRVMPVHNGRELIHDRLWFIYCLVTGKTINMGYVIHDWYESAVCDTVYTPLPFPTLITDLCLKAGVRKKTPDTGYNGRMSMGQRYFRDFLKEPPPKRATQKQAPAQDPQGSETQREVDMQKLRNDVAFAKYLEELRRDMMISFNHLAIGQGSALPQLPPHTPLHNMNPFENPSVNDEDNDGAEVGEGNDAFIEDMEADN